MIFVSYKDERMYVTLQQHLESKTMRTFFEIIMITFLLCCCSGDSEVQAQDNGTMTEKINLTIDGQTMTMTLVDNAATHELVEALREGNIVVTLNDNDFEQWGDLGRTFTTSNESMTCHAGDVVLYASRYICLFYGSNSYSYTRLGKMEYQTLDQLKSFLKAGQDNVRLTLSLAETAAIEDIKNNKQQDGAYYTLNGQRVTNPSHGLYIRNGKKVKL